jgi:non-specific serine/threonine protein kinase/serine/threonine-protein kinase
MELVAGESITQFCDRHGLGARDRVQLLVSVCRAIEHAHQKGVIHRDVKPSNILVTLTDGRPFAKVIDFGIAKATHVRLTDSTLATSHGETVGTPEYASPEQLQSGGIDVDTRTDVYSLGVVLHRLLTGRLPFDSESMRRAGPAEAARMMSERPLSRPSALVATGGGTAALVTKRDLQGDLDWILLKALHPDRDGRYASAAALADDLERFLQDQPVVAGPPSATYRLEKFVRRHRTAVAGTTAVFLALVAGLSATAWQARRAQRASASSAAVNAFLTRMIAGANPEANPAGRDVTVREMVDRAVTMLDSSGAGDASVEGGIRHAIGVTYMGLGLYDRAAAQLMLAGRIRGAAGSSSRQERIETTLALADAEGRRGQYARSDSMLVALQAHEPVLAAETRIESLRLRAYALANLSRTSEADSLYEMAIVLARRTPGSATDVLAAALGDLAGVRSSLGRNEEAASLARESLHLTRRDRSREHHDVAVAASRLAEILQQAGNFAAAESLHREALAIDERALGQDHPMVATRLSNLAWTLTDAGKLEEAEAMHRRAVALHVATLGENHPTVAIARGHLATVLQLRGSLEEALTLRLAALDALRRHFGDEHEEVANAWNNLASAYRLMHRYDDAVGAFRAAMPIFAALYGPVHPTLAICKHNLGKTLTDAERPAEAEPLLREALEIGHQVYPIDHVNLAFFQATLGRTLGALGHWDEADSTLGLAEAKIRAALGADHPRTIEVAQDRARIERERRRESAIR